MTRALPSVTLCSYTGPDAWNVGGNPTAGAVRASERSAVNVCLPFVIARCMTRHYSRAQMKKLLILALLLLAGCSRSTEQVGWTLYDVQGRIWINEVRYSHGKSLSVQTRWRLGNTNHSRSERSQSF